jgi:heme oxygenase
MLARLEHATCHEHVAADADRLALLRPTATRAEYVEYLVGLYGFEAPVETGLAVTIASLPNARPRTALLRSDLLVLGEAHIPLAPRPMPRTPAEALGWLYVVERGRLLHGILYRHLGTVLPHELDVAGSYLASHAGTTGIRWRELGDVLDSVARSRASVEATIANALAAFCRQRLWFQHARTARHAA